MRGATGLAHSYGVPPLLVGLTIVAFGTSAPELMVNVVGALKEQTDIAFGNQKRYPPFIAGKFSNNNNDP